MVRECIEDVDVEELLDAVDQVNAQDTEQVLGNLPKDYSQVTISELPTSIDVQFPKQLLSKG